MRGVGVNYAVTYAKKWGRNLGAFRLGYHQYDAGSSNLVTHRSGKQFIIGFDQKKQYTAEAQTADLSSYSSGSASETNGVTYNAAQTIYKYSSKHNFVQSGNFNGVTTAFTKTGSASGEDIIGWNTAFWRPPSGEYSRDEPGLVSTVRWDGDIGDTFRTWGAGQGMYFSTRGGSNFFTIHWSTFDHNTALRCWSSTLTTYYQRRLNSGAPCAPSQISYDRENSLVHITTSNYSDGCSVPIDVASINLITSSSFTSDDFVYHNLLNTNNVSIEQGVFGTYATITKSQFLYNPAFVFNTDDDGMPCYDLFESIKYTNNTDMSARVADGKRETLKELVDERSYVTNNISRLSWDRENSPSHFNAVNTSQAPVNLTTIFRFVSETMQQEIWKTKHVTRERFLGMSTTRLMQWYGTDISYPDPYTKVKEYLTYGKSGLRFGAKYHSIATENTLLPFYSSSTYFSTKTEATDFYSDNEDVVRAFNYNYEGLTVNYNTKETHTETRVNNDTITIDTAIDKKTELSTQRAYSLKYHWRSETNYIDRQSRINFLGAGFFTIRKHTSFVNKCLKTYQSYTTVLNKETKTRTSTNIVQLDVGKHSKLPGSIYRYDRKGLSYWNVSHNNAVFHNQFNRSVAISRKMPDVILLNYKFISYLDSRGRERFRSTDRSSFMTAVTLNNLLKQSIYITSRTLGNSTNTVTGSWIKELTYAPVEYNMTTSAGVSSFYNRGRGDRRLAQLSRWLGKYSHVAHTVVARYETFGEAYSTIKTVETKSDMLKETWDEPNGQLANGYNRCTIIGGLDESGKGITYYIGAGVETKILTAKYGADGKNIDTFKQMQGLGKNARLMSWGISSLGDSVFTTSGKDFTYIRAFTPTYLRTQQMTIMPHDYLFKDNHLTSFRSEYHWDAEQTHSTNQTLVNNCLYRDEEDYSYQLTNSFILP